MDSGLIHGLGFIKTQKQPRWGTTWGRGKGKAILVQARVYAEGSRKVSFPDLMTTVI